MTKSAIVRFHEERQALNKFNVAAVLRDEPVLAVVRRELKRAFPNLNPPLDQIRDIVAGEVLKREVVEGEKAELAAKAMRKAGRRRCVNASREEKATGGPDRSLPRWRPRSDGRHPSTLNP